MNNLEYKLIINILKKSVNLFYETDSYLLETNIHEQNISHRIAYYFENKLNESNIPSSYNIDVEYNRNLQQEKNLFEKCSACSNKKCYAYNMQCSNKRPDIILHRRGNNNSNIIVIEIKKDNDCDNDFAKLSAFTCKKSDYAYKLGIWLNITNNKPKYTYFVNAIKYKRCPFRKLT